MRFCHLKFHADLIKLIGIHAHYFNFEDLHYHHATKKQIYIYNYKLTQMSNPCSLVVIPSLYLII